MFEDIVISKSLQHVQQAALFCEARHKVIAEFLVILGIDRTLAEDDACIIEHHLSPESAERVKQFVEFIQTSSMDPEWIEKFRAYCGTGVKITAMDKDITL